MASSHHRHEVQRCGACAQSRPPAAPQSAGTTAASSQDRRPNEPGTGLTASRLPWSRSASSPDQRSGRPPQGAGRTEAPAGKLRQPPDHAYVRASVV